MYPGFSRVDKYLESIALFVAAFICKEIIMDSNKYTPAYRESINISVESIALFVATFVFVDLAKKSRFKQIYPGLSRVNKYLESIALFDTGSVINLPMYTGFSRVVYSTPHGSVILISLETRLVSRQMRW